MGRYRKLLAIPLFAALATPAMAQIPCKDGTSTALSGTIESAKQEKGDKGEDIWTIIPRGNTRGACIIFELWGDGKLPAGCSKGHSFRATGKVIDAMEVDVIALDVRSISCN